MSLPFPHDHDHDHDHADHDHDEGHEGHGHGAHGFGHAHVHAPANFGVAFAAGIALNGLYVIVAAVAGVTFHSLSLLAEAGHNLSDVLGLAAAWLADALARRAPTPRFTYGLRRSTILAALVNAMILLVATGGIMWEAILRLGSHAPVNGAAIGWVALAGIVVNGGSALLLMRGASSDLNIRGAFVHLAGDAAMSLGVVIAGLLIFWTGWVVIDPIVSLLVSASIVAGTWALLRDALVLSLDAVPPGIAPGDVRAALLAVPGVNGLHDLHIWPMSTTETALTVHLIRDDGAQRTPDQIIRDAASVLREKFGIAHPTFQIENPPSPCDLQRACC